MQTYRAHTHLRARFNYPSNSFVCLSSCCSSSSMPAFNLTLSALERHWGRGKARKAWSNTLKVSSEDPTHVMQSLQQLLQMREDANSGKGAASAAMISLPSSRVNLTGTNSRSVQQPQPPRFVERTMCVMRGCSQSICHDCKPPSKTNTIKRHFWACHACRIRLGLPTATREVTQVANASTRSKRVSYAPPRFEDWIEQHEAEVSIRRRAEPVESPSSQVQESASSPSPRSPPPAMQDSSKEDDTYAKPLAEGGVALKAPSTPPSLSRCGKITIPIDKPRKQYMQPKAAPQSKEARKAERKNRRKRRREQDADQVSHKWTSKGPGHFTWLPHLAPKQSQEPAQPRNTFVLTAVLPSELLLNPFVGSRFAGCLAPELHRETPSSSKQRRITFKSQGLVCASASMPQVLEGSTAHHPLEWNVETVEVHEGITFVKQMPRIELSAFIDLAALKQ